MHKHKLPHQVSEVVSILSGHESAGVAEASDVLDVGLQSRRVRLQHDVDERGEEVVRWRRLSRAGFDGVEDVLAAAGDARQLVFGHALRVHLDHIWSRAEIWWVKRLIGKIQRGLKTTPVRARLTCDGFDDSVGHLGDLLVHRNAQHLNGDPVQRSATGHNQDFNLNVKL